jgi:hypothetical protein
MAETSVTQCATLSWHSHGENAVQIEWLTPHLEIEKHPNGVGQYLAHEPMLEVPQIMHADTRHRKVLGQLRPDCFDDFTPAGTRAHQAERLGRRHPRSWWGHNVNALMLCQHGVLILVNEPFVCRNQATGIAFHQGIEELDTMGAGRQQRIVGDQATPRDTQAEFEPNGMKFRGKLSVYKGGIDVGLP